MESQHPKSKIMKLNIRQFCVSERLGNRNFAYFMNNLTQSENDAVVNVEVDPAKLLEGIPQESAKK